MQSGETRGREVSEETPGPVQVSVRGGREVRAEGRADRTWKEAQLRGSGLQALGGRDRKVPELQRELKARQAA